MFQSSVKNETFNDYKCFLIKKYIARNEPSSLHKAVRKKENAKVSLILDQGADPNITNNLGETPLLYAIKTENYEAVRLLIEHGVDLEKPDFQNFTILAYALFMNATSIFELLLKSGVDVNREQGIYKQTPLILALKRFDFESAQILIHFGAHVNWDLLYKICRKTFDDNDYDDDNYCADLFIIFGNNYDFKNVNWGRRYLNDKCRYIAKRDFKYEDFYELQQSDYYQECIEELKDMRAITFDDDGFSLYDFFKGSRNKLINYMKNKKFYDRLEKILREGHFKIFGNMLRINSIVGKRYGRLYDKVNFIDPNCKYSLPISVRDNVLQYLNERDINNLIRAQSLS